MSKIKVGQIWQQSNGYKIVVTALDVDLIGEVIVIFQDGDVAYKSKEDTEFSFCTLLAEYPTWQEAVNSKEFNNGN